MLHGFRARVQRHYYPTEESQAEPDRRISSRIWAGRNLHSHAILLPLISFGRSRSTTMARLKVTSRQKASFPDTWRRIEGGAELGKIDEAFDLLVKDRGALEAIRVVCTLIFPNVKSMAL